MISSAQTANLRSRSRSDLRAEFAMGFMFGLALFGSLAISQFVALAVSCTLLLLFALNQRHDLRMISLQLLASGAFVAVTGYSMFSAADDTRVARNVLYAFALLAACIYLVSGRHQFQVKSLYFWLAAALTLCHSVLISLSIATSLTHIAIFAGFMIPILVAIESREAQPLRESFGVWLAGGMTAYMAISFVYLAVGLGYAVNGVDFQGPISHPQSFGVVAGFAAVLLAGQVRSWWGRLFLLAAALLLIWESNTRTALAGLIVASPFLLVLPGLRRGSAWNSLFHGSVPYVVTGALIVSVMVAFFLVLVPAEWVPSIIADFDTARGFLFKRSVDNVLQQPLLGMGFGIPSNPAMLDSHYYQISKQLFLETAEKGNSYLALVEELGVFGASVWMIFFGRLILDLSRNTVVGSAGVVFLALVIMGEAILFAPGGVGALAWLCVICREARNGTALPSR